ncbi:LAETG motif-containing sortase-dependent surface protein [Streptomyces nodosus]|uniref:LAETG motif-containing sortase-dependent surface protein n=1 Tax=Streptomyces nodosus TaxID=40318 RepID=UPI0036E66630
MSISSRTSRTVRILGVASATAALALGTAGTALACNIKDFSAVASCDDNGKGVITVTDKDGSRQKATVSVFLSTDGSETKVDEKEVTGTREGATVTFSEDWAPGATYRIHVKAGKNLVDEDIKPNLTAPSKACASSEPAPEPSETTPSAPEETAPATVEPTASAPESSEAAEPSAEASESDSAAPAAGGENFPSPAAGTSNLAETGSSSSTPLIAGIAAVLVVAGGGAVFFGMRRRGASKA